MKSATGLALCDFRCKTNSNPVFSRQVSEYPFSNDQFISQIFHVHRIKLDFVLFVIIVFSGKIAYFRMAIFNFSANLCYIPHSFDSQLFEFSKRLACVIAFLVSIRKILVYFCRCNDIIFQLAQSFDFHASGFFKTLMGFSQNVFWCALQRPSFFGVVSTH